MSGVLIGCEIHNEELESKYYDHDLSLPLHITIAYLGDVPAATILQVRDVLKGVSMMCQSFEAQLYAVTRWHGTYVVGLLTVPKWVFDMRKRIIEWLKSYSIPVSDKYEFNPHVTLRKDGQILYPKWQQRLKIESIALFAEDSKWTFHF